MPLVSKNYEGTATKLIDEWTKRQDEYNDTYTTAHADWITKRDEDKAKYLKGTAWTNCMASQTDVIEKCQKNGYDTYTESTVGVSLCDLAHLGYMAHNTGLGRGYL